MHVVLENPNFSDLFKRILYRFLNARYNLDVRWETACLVFNRITIMNAMLHSLVAVVQASDSMAASK